MTRLVAAGRIRATALAGADAMATSRVLLAELSALLGTYYRRGPDEQPERVGAHELRSWWAEHAASLVESHRDIAAAFLAPLVGILRSC